jgi:HK97 gp10 family phage protein
MKLSIDIGNARQFDEMLKQLPANIARRAAGNALRAGARVIRDEARRQVPRESGKLAKAIKVITGRSTRLDRRRVLVIVTNKDAGINPHWIEYGTVAQRVAKSGGYLTFVIDGKFIRKKSVAGVRAKPFMRPAADAKVGQAVDVIGSVLGEAIEKEATKLGRR